ncbi:MAG: Hsp20/alpha crystallin family protein [Nanoarchaeota archaeon]|nr:Hsp20/alpha crystallin family protein [Nanoarchaeota archaeon]
MESEIIKRMSMFLPPEVKKNIVNSLKGNYKGKIYSKFTPQTLALALQYSPETKDLLKEQVLDEINNLCTSLGVLKKEIKEEEFLKALDEKNRAIVMYVWRSRHAKIRDLSKLINAENDAYILTKIREIINPLAKNILGKPILCFEESKIDPVTGNKILFSWWLNEGIELIKKKEALDIFDEKDKLRIVTELPNLNEEDIIVSIENDGIIISANNYYQRVPLFCAVEKKIEKTYKNGILEISLKKLR